MMRSRRFSAIGGAPFWRVGLIPMCPKKFLMPLGCERAHGETIITEHSGREDRIGINPFTRRRLTIRRRTLEPQCAAGARPLDHFNLPPRDLVMAALADPDVIERMPEMEFIETAKGIDLVFGRQSQRGERAHEPREWRLAKKRTIRRKTVARIGGNLTPRSMVRAMVPARWRDGPSGVAAAVLSRRSLGCGWDKTAGGDTRR